MEMRSRMFGFAILGWVGALVGCGADAPFQGSEALTAEECEAQGGQLFLAQPYDATRGCYQEPAEPAFCQPVPDIICAWQGEPVLLTAPDGATWYVDWSCFSTPEGWTRQYVAEGRPACDAELSCLERPVEDCEAHGCQVFLAQPYDQAAGCYQEPAVPAFCQADPDIVCGWQGDPILLTEPDGTTWYIDWSCFSTPETWDREYVPGGKPGCG